METRANHVLIGAFTVLLAGFLALFALWLGKATLDREWNHYVVVFEEAVTGLTVGGGVQFNGIQVGEVRDLAIDPDNPSRVLATIRVSATAPVKTDTVARLALTGLTGVAVIQLSGGTREAPLLYAGPDGRPPWIIAEASALQRLLASSEDIFTTASEVMLRIRDLLDEDNLGRIVRTLEHLEATTGTIAESREDIRDLLAGTAEASRALNRTLDRAERAFARIDGAAASFDAAVMQELPAAMESLRNTLARLESVAENADALIADNRESITEFSQQGLAEVGPTLTEMRRLVRDLRQVTERFDQGPARYLMGRQRAPEFEP